LDDEKPVPVIYKAGNTGDKKEDGEIA